MKRVSQKVGRVSLKPESIEQVYLHRQSGSCRKQLTQTVAYVTLEVSGGSLFRISKFVQRSLLCQIFLPLFSTYTLHQTADPEGYVSFDVQALQIMLALHKQRFRYFLLSFLSVAPSFSSSCPKKTPKFRNLLPYMKALTQMVGYVSLEAEALQHNHIRDKQRLFWSTLCFSNC
jgi:hypothetical protein